MNGYPIQVLAWLVGGLLGLVNVLIGFIIFLHLKSDDERHNHHKAEIDMLRKRVHDWGDRVSGLLAKSWLEEARAKKGGD